MAALDIGRQRLAEQWQRLALGRPHVRRQRIAADVLPLRAEMDQRRQLAGSQPGEPAAFVDPT